MDIKGLGQNSTGSNCVSQTRARGIAGSSVLALALLAGTAFGGPWPDSSREPVQPAAHPTLEQRLEATGTDPEAGFRFVAFGDQRALADGEWQAMMQAIGDLATADPRILFMIDTGDIVQNGTYSDQFAMLHRILAPAAGLPYWVGVGNHELASNGNPTARKNTSRFFSGFLPGAEEGRLFYEKQVGPVRFLFLDSNDYSYPTFDPIRREAQTAWLLGQLEVAGRHPDSLTVVTLHHPLVQSSSKHRNPARDLWSLDLKGRSLIDRLLDAGVDLVLCGHTHTYERFRIRRPDGRELVLANVSGRPRGGFLGFGAGARRAKDIRGKELEWLRDKGWEIGPGWEIHQETAMTRDDANQFALVEITEDGAAFLQVHYLEENTVRLGPREPLWAAH